ncbi:hypothetical protein E0494_03490 [Marinilabiliaceae bacterium JC040]|nr:hypothetical protein [Marinilabiliaceae bacterium JC040]
MRLILKTTILYLFIFMNTNLLLYANSSTYLISNNYNPSKNTPPYRLKHVLLNIDMASLSYDYNRISMKIDEYGSGDYILDGKIDQTNNNGNINFYSTLRFNGDFTYIKTYRQFPDIDNANMYAVIRNENGKFSITNNNTKILKKRWSSDGYRYYKSLHLGDDFKGEISEVMLTNPRLSDIGLNIYFNLKYGISNSGKDYKILKKINYSNRYTEKTIFKSREEYSKDIFALGNMKFNYENIDYTLSQGISHSVNTENEIGDLIVSINNTKDNNNLCNFFNENSYLFFASNGKNFDVDKSIDKGYKVLKRKWRYITEGGFYNRDINNVVLKIKTPENMDSYKVIIDKDDNPNNGYIKEVDIYYTNKNDKYKSVTINSNDFKRGEYIYFACKDSYTSIKSHLDCHLKLMNPCKGKNNGYAKVLIDNPIILNKTNTSEYIDCNFSIPKSENGYTLEGLFGIRKCDINDQKMYFLLGQKSYISIGISGNYFCSFHNGKITYLCSINEYPNDGLLHHIALTVSKNRMKFYIDGILKYRKIINELQYTNKNNHFCIGGKITNYNDFFSGYILRVGLWNTVLGEREMKQMYNTKYQYDRKDNRLISAYAFNDIDSENKIIPISSKIQSKAKFISNDPIQYLYKYQIHWKDKSQTNIIERHDLSKSKSYNLSISMNGIKEKELKFSLKETSLEASLVDVVGECCEHDICNFGVKINKSTISEYVNQNIFTYKFIEDDKLRREINKTNKLTESFLENSGEELLYNNQHNGEVHFKIEIIDNNSCSIKLDYIVNVHKIVQSKKISIKI